MKLAVQTTKHFEEKEEEWFWIQDDEEVFVQAKLIQRNQDGTIVVRKEHANSIGVRLEESSCIRIFDREAANENLEDLIKHADVSPPTILNALRSRFQRDQIYTYIGSILVAMNPFKWINNLYSNDVIQFYRSVTPDLDETDRPPHIFAISQDSYAGARTGVDQCVIISGESGAGKTEAAKQCLQFVAAVAGSGSGVEKKIIAASPILETYGNAKTLRNNNSSRFGKFMEVLFDRRYAITGCKNTPYLLEKSRVVFQERGERNYHSFYQFVVGAPAELRDQFHVSFEGTTPTDACNNFHYLNQSGCVSVDGLDETKSFEETWSAMKDMEFADSERLDICRCISAVLHFGNIEFEVDPSDEEKCRVTESSMNSLRIASELTGTESIMILQALTFRVVRSGKRSSVSHVPLRLDGARENRDALTKDFYNRMFLWIVNRINIAVNTKLKHHAMIGLLDIFGFEIFVNNSFEQLCINFANEKLQQHFNHHVFQMEIELYNLEDIDVTQIQYKDNSDLLDLICNRSIGLLPLLDEECIIPKGNWQSFMNKFVKANKDNQRLKHKTMSSSFEIVHYAGEVRYSPDGFLRKNKDTLSEDIVSVMRSSDFPFIVTIFDPLFDVVESETEKSGLSRHSPSKASKLSMNARSAKGFSPESTNSASRTQSVSASNKMTVGTQFKQQLEQLMTVLDACYPHYVRCIKTNALKRANMFTSTICYEQLRYSGVFEAVIIRQSGYPFKMSLLEFRRKYHVIYADSATKSCLFQGGNDNAREQCQFLIKYAGTIQPTLSLCQIGKTMIFYKPEQHRKLEKWRSPYWNAAVMTTQKYIRGYQSRTIVKGIQVAISKLRVAIQLLNSDDMTEQISELNKIFPKATSILSVVAQIKWLPLCLELLSELKKRKALEDRLESLLPRPAIEVYDAVLSVVNEAEDIFFEDTIAGISVLVDGMQEDITSRANRKCEDVRRIIELKKTLIDAMAIQDDLIMRSSLERLRSHRLAGDIDNRYCEAEQRQATKILTQIEEDQRGLLPLVDAGLKKGAIKITSGGLIDFSAIEVDHLSDIVSRESIRSGIIAKRARILQVVKELILFRQAVKSEAWEKVEDCLRHWVAYVSEISLHFRSEEVVHEESKATENKNDDERQKRLERKRENKKKRLSKVVRSENTLTTASDVVGAVSSTGQSSASLVPDNVVPLVYELRDVVQHEIRGGYKAYVFRTYFPAVIATINDGRIREPIPIDIALIETAKLDKLIKKLSMFEGFLVAELDQLIRSTNQLLEVRLSVVSGSVERLQETLELASNPSADLGIASELVVAYQHLQYITVANSLKCGFLGGGPVGKSGNMDFSKISTNDLELALLSASTCHYASKAWVDLVQMSQIILDTRLRLIKIQKCYNSSDQPIFEGGSITVELSECKQFLESIVRERHIDVIDETANSDLKFAHFEVLECLREIIHRNGVCSILLALSKGAVKGAIGNVDTSSVQFQLLESAVEESKSKLVPGKLSSSLIESALMVSKIRKHAVDKTIDLLLPEMDEFCEKQDPHASCADEISIAMSHARDYCLHRILMSAVAQDCIVLSSENESDIKESDLLNLTTAVMKAKQYGIVVLSNGVKKLYRAARLLLFLRMRILQHIWEPSPRNVLVHTKSVVSSLCGVSAVTMGLNRQSSLSLLENDEVDFIDGDVITNSKLECVESILELVSEISLPEVCDEEILATRREFQERKLRRLLVDSINDGRIKGTVNDIDLSSCTVSQILDALVLVSSTVHKTSNTIRNLKLLAQLILRCRRTFLSKNYQTLPINDLLLTIEENLASGAGVEELRLMLDVALNLKAQLSLESYLQTEANGFIHSDDGRMSGFEQAISSAAINVKNLSVRTKSLLRSSRWIFDIRQAAMKNTLWTTMNTIIKSSHSSDQELSKFLRDNRSVSHPIMPILSSQDARLEIAYFMTEGYRRILHQQLLASMDTDGLRGSPGSLDLLHVSVADLSESVHSFESFMSFHDVHSISSLKLIDCGKTVITLRKILLHLRDSVAMSPEFYRVNNEEEISREWCKSLFIHTQRNLNDISQRRTNLWSADWDLLLSEVRNANISRSIHYRSFLEIEMLRTECLERKLCYESFCALLVGKVSELDTNAISLSLSAIKLVLEKWKMHSIKMQFDQRQVDGDDIPFSSFAKRMHRSVVVVYFLRRSVSESRYAPPQRDWNSIEASQLYACIPIEDFALGISQSFTVQEILVNAMQLDLHPVALNEVTYEYQRVQDLVSMAELGGSLRQNCLHGNPGELKAVGSESVDSLSSAVDRSAAIGCWNEDAKSMLLVASLNLAGRRSVMAMDFILFGRIVISCLMRGIIVSSIEMEDMVPFTVEEADFLIKLPQSLRDGFVTVHQLGYTEFVTACDELADSICVSILRESMVWSGLIFSSGSIKFVHEDTSVLKSAISKSKCLCSVTSFKHQMIRHAAVLLLEMRTNLISHLNLCKSGCNKNSWIDDSLYVHDAMSNFLSTVIESAHGFIELHSSISISQFDNSRGPALTGSSVDLIGSSVVSEVNCIVDFAQHCNCVEEFLSFTVKPLLHLSDSGLILEISDRNKLQQVISRMPSTWLDGAKASVLSENCQNFDAKEEKVQATTVRRDNAMTLFLFIFQKVFNLFDSISGCKDDHCLERQSEYASTLLISSVPPKAEAFLSVLSQNCKNLIDLIDWQVFGRIEISSSFQSLKQSLVDIILFVEEGSFIKDLSALFVAPSLTLQDDCVMKCVDSLIVESVIEDLKMKFSSILNSAKVVLLVNLTSSMFEMRKFASLCQWKNGLAVADSILSQRTALRSYGLDGLFSCCLQEADIFHRFMRNKRQAIPILKELLLVQLPSTPLWSVLPTNHLDASSISHQRLRFLLDNLSSECYDCDTSIVRSLRDVCSYIWLVMASVKSEKWAEGVDTRRKKVLAGSELSSLCKLFCLFDEPSDVVEAVTMPQFDFAIPYNAPYCQTPKLFSSVGSIIDDEWLLFLNEGDCISTDYKFDQIPLLTKDNCLGGLCGIPLNSEAIDIAEAVLCVESSITHWKASIAANWSLDEHAEFWVMAMFVEDLVTLKIAPVRFEIKLRSLYFNILDLIIDSKAIEGYLQTRIPEFENLTKLCLQALANYGNCLPLASLARSGLLLACLWRNLSQLNWVEIRQLIGFAQRYLNFGYSEIDNIHEQQTVDRVPDLSNSMFDNFFDVVSCDGDIEAILDKLRDLMPSPSNNSDKSLCSSNHDALMSLVGTEDENTQWIKILEESSDGCSYNDVFLRLLVVNEVERLSKIADFEACYDSYKKCCQFGSAFGIAGEIDVEKISSVALVSCVQECSKLKWVAGWDCECSSNRLIKCINLTIQCRNRRIESDFSGLLNIFKSSQESFPGISSLLGLQEVVGRLPDIEFVFDELNLLYRDCLENQVVQFAVQAQDSFLFPLLIGDWVPSSIFIQGLVTCLDLCKELNPQHPKSLKLCCGVEYLLTVAVAAINGNWIEVLDLSYLNCAIEIELTERALNQIMNICRSQSLDRLVLNELTNAAENGKIGGDIGNVDTSLVCIQSISSALSLANDLQNDRRSFELDELMVISKHLLVIREAALQNDWQCVFDSSNLVLECEKMGMFMLPQSIREESMFAIEHARFTMCKQSLCDCLAIGGMIGQVGLVDCLLVDGECLARTIDDCTSLDCDLSTIPHLVQSCILVVRLRNAISNNLWERNGLDFATWNAEWNWFSAHPLRNIQEDIVSKDVSNSNSALLKGILLHKCLHITLQEVSTYNFIDSEISLICELLSSNPAAVSPRNWDDQSKITNESSKFLHDFFSRYNIQHVEFVEDILIEIGQKKLPLSDDVEKEVTFVRNHLLHRKIVHVMRAAIEFGRASGTAGNLDLLSIKFEHLERVSQLFSSLPECCKVLRAEVLYRDCQLLATARKSRLTWDWDSLCKLLDGVKNLSAECLPQVENGKIVDRESVEQLVGPSKELASLLQFHKSVAWCGKFVCLINSNVTPVCMLANSEMGLMEEDMNFYRCLKKFVSCSAVEIGMIKYEDIWTIGDCISYSMEFAPNSSEFRRLFHAMEKLLELRVACRFGKIEEARNVILQSEKEAINDEKCGFVSYTQLMMQECGAVKKILNDNEIFNRISLCLQSGACSGQVGKLCVTSFDESTMRNEISLCKMLMSDSTSEFAKRMIYTADMMLKVRSLVKYGDWNAIQSWFTELDVHKLSEDVSKEVGQIQAELDNYLIMNDLHSCLSSDQAADCYGLMISTAPSEPQRSLKYFLDVEDMPIDLKSIRLDRLDRALKAAADFPFISSDLKCLIYTGGFIRKLRLAESSKSWDVVDGILDLEGKSKILPFVLPELQLARCALHHKRSCQKLASGLANGKVMGSIGNLVLSNIVTADLETAIEFALSIEVREIYLLNLIEIAQHVLQLRKSVKANLWLNNEDTSGEMESLYESSKIDNESDNFPSEFDKLSTLHREFSFSVESAMQHAPKQLSDLAAQEIGLVHEELSQKKIIFHLTSALSSFDPSVTKSLTEMAHSRIKTVDDHEFGESYLGDKPQESVESLRKAIYLSNLLVPMSLETKTLLAVSVILLDIRLCVFNGDWDGFLDCLAKANNILEKDSVCRKYVEREVKFYNEASVSWRVIKAALISCLSTNCVSGTFEELKIGEVTFDKLDHWLGEAKHWKANVGQLAASQERLILEAEIILLMRSGLLRDDKLMVNQGIRKLTGSNIAHRHKISVAIQEMTLVAGAVRYRSLMTTLQSIISQNPFSGSTGTLYFSSPNIDALGVGICSAADFVTRLVAEKSKSRGIKFDSVIRTNNYVSTVDDAAKYAKTKFYRRKSIGCMFSVSRRNISTRSVRSDDESDQLKPVSADIAVDAAQETIVKNWDSLTEYKDLKIMIRNSVCLRLLWRSVKENIWEIEKIVSGKVDSFGFPSDKILQALFSRLKQSVTPRFLSSSLNSVHLGSLQEIIVTDGIASVICRNDSEIASVSGKRIKSTSIESIPGLLAMIDWNVLIPNVRNQFSAVRNEIVHHSIKRRLQLGLSIGQVRRTRNGDIDVDKIFFDELEISIRDTHRVESIAKKIEPNATFGEEITKLYLIAQKTRAFRIAVLNGSYEDIGSIISLVDEKTAMLENCGIGFTEFDCCRRIFFEYQATTALHKVLSFTARLIDGDGNMFLEVQNAVHKLSLLRQKSQLSRASLHLLKCGEFVLNVWHSRTACDINAIERVLDQAHTDGLDLECHTGAFIDHLREKCREARLVERLEMSMLGSRTISTDEIQQMVTAASNMSSIDQQTESLIHSAVILQRLRQVAATKDSSALKSLHKQFFGKTVSKSALPNVPQVFSPTLDVSQNVDLLLNEDHIAQQALLKFTKSANAGDSANGFINQGESLLPQVREQLELVRNRLKQDAVYVHILKQMKKVCDNSVSVISDPENTAAPKKLLDNLEKVVNSIKHDEAYTDAVLSLIFISKIILCSSIPIVPSRNRELGEHGRSASVRTPWYRYPTFLCRCIERIHAENGLDLIIMGNVIRKLSEKSHNQDRTFRNVGLPVDWQAESSLQTALRRSHTVLRVDVGCSVEDIKDTVFEVYGITGHGLAESEILQSKSKQMGISNDVNPEQLNLPMPSSRRNSLAMSQTGSAVSGTSFRRQAIVPLVDDSEKAKLASVRNQRRRFSKTSSETKSAVVSNKVDGTYNIRNRSRLVALLRLVDAMTNLDESDFIRDAVRFRKLHVIDSGVSSNNNGGNL